MIKFLSTKTGQSLGHIRLLDGHVSLSPTSMRRVMETLAASDIGHLVMFEFAGCESPATCLFGERANSDINSINRGRSSDFSPL